MKMIYNVGLPLSNQHATEGARIVLIQRKKKMKRKGEKKRPESAQKKIYNSTITGQTQCAEEDRVKQQKAPERLLKDVVL